MKMTNLALIFGFVFLCGILINGQNAPVTNLAGVPFPVVQYMPNNLTAQGRTTINGVTQLQRVEFRTIGIILRADEADVDTSTGEYVLRGNVRATLIPVRPIFPESRQ